jgi:flagellar basal body rod protein FlgB
VFEEKNVVPGNDLNYVSLDHEMGRIGANALRFQAIGKMVAKHLGILRYAASDTR